jgi:hypothetical protein
MVKLFQLLEEYPVALAWPFSPDRWSRRGDVGEYRESQELPLSGTPPDPGYPRIDELHDRPEHLVGREGVPSMQPERTPAQAEHYRAVRVSEDLVDFRQPQVS